MFLQMLKDEFPDVRLHIISKLELVNKGTFSHILWVTLAKTSSHRYRASVAVSSSRHSTASRGQTMASPVGHN